MSAVTWISAGPQHNEYITIDAQQRLYLSAGACELIGVPKAGHFALNVGYDKVNRRIVVAKPDVVRLNDVRPFSFDARRYGHARAFVREAGVAPDDLPLHFDYVGKDYGAAPKGSYAFSLAEFHAPDDEGRA